VNLEGAAANTNIGAVRVERLHAQRHVRATSAIIVIIIVIIVVITPARPFGVGTLSHPDDLLSLPVSAIRQSKYRRDLINPAAHMVWRWSRLIIRPSEPDHRKFR
jgi:hypothetical protein